MDHDAVQDVGTVHHAEAAGENAIEAHRLAILHVIPDLLASDRVGALGDFQCFRVRAWRFVGVQHVGAARLDSGDRRRGSVVKPPEPLFLEGVEVTAR